ncbi:MAG: DUF1566 domain-containing protein [Candidatus Desulfatibia sp.]|uniref:Lcl C-terminal domain-containing protein n=1 Tax=Candidatus Desulfatibia sp. TaxID=3101189 RepID=UPI002F332D4C
MNRIVCAVLIALLAVSCTSDAETEAGRDATFIKYANGVIYDKKTGLEWYTGPDKETNWNGAKQWVERLQVAGGGWRMPTREELKTLYEKDVGTRNMTPLLETTGWWVWSGETKGSSSAWGFGFPHGREGWIYRDSAITGRGFAMRSRK